MKTKTIDGDGVVEVEGALVLCTQDDQWFTIEKAFHENKMEFRFDEGNKCHALWYSGRISDADVEGDAPEMVEIAKAIKAKTSYGAKRCFVSVKEDKAYFSSPRNSSYSAEVPFSVADKLADDILDTLG